jgi:hypothetical protein
MSGEIRDYQQINFQIGRIYTSAALLNTGKWIWNAVSLAVWMHAWMCAERVDGGYLYSVFKSLFSTVRCPMNPNILIPYKMLDFTLVQKHIKTRNYDKKINANCPLMSWTAYKKTPPTVILCHGNVPNDLIVNLMEIPDNGRLRRQLPDDLRTRFLV